MRIADGRRQRPETLSAIPHDVRDHGIRGSRSSSLSPRQPPCWQPGEPPLFKVWAQMPGTGGRSPGSRVVVSDEHLRIFLTFPKVDAARKGGRFVDDRGVRPRLIAQPFSGFSGWFALRAVRTTRTATRHVFPAGRKTLAALQSRGRLRLAVPVWIPAVAFPFASRATGFRPGNHPSFWNRGKPGASQSTERLTAWARCSPCRRRDHREEPAAPHRRA